MSGSFELVTISGIERWKAFVSRTTFGFRRYTTEVVEEDGGFRAIPSNPRSHITEISSSVNLSTSVVSNLRCKDSKTLTILVGFVKDIE